MKKLLCLLLCLLLTGCAAAPVADQTVGTSCAATTGLPAAEPLKVAVIDTGFSSAIPTENVIPGANYLDPEAGTEDTYGHGTAVASVILSVAPEAMLVPLVSSMYDRGRMTHVSGEVLSQMIRDAVDVYGCRIINVSAGLGSDTPALQEAVDYARQQGVLVIASAGNDYGENPGVAYYPAAYDEVLAVGALDGEVLAAFTQRGEWVDLYAPGTDVVVTTLSGGSRKESGTSYAAAFVCGKAAQLCQARADMTPDGLIEALKESATVLDSGHLALGSQREEKEAQR